MSSAAGAVSILLGLGFGLPCVFAIRHFAQTGEVWRFLGYPAYGDGPFERIGVATSVPLLVGFLVVCLAEVAVGVLIWTEHPLGTALGYAILPFELAYWVGFALPFGPVLGAARTTLLLLA